MLLSNSHSMQKVHEMAIFTQNVVYTQIATEITTSRRIKTTFSVYKASMGTIWCATYTYNISGLQTYILQHFIVYPY